MSHSDRPCQHLVRKLSSFDNQPGHRSGELVTIGVDLALISSLGAFRFGVSFDNRVADSGEDIEKTRPQDAYFRADWEGFR